jgi:hypothetical protein
MDDIEKDSQQNTTTEIEDTTMSMETQTSCKLKSVFKKGYKDRVNAFVISTKGKFILSGLIFAINFYGYTKAMDCLNFC